MIVISGALVLVALVLLVIGLLGASLGFVYASIGVSLASGLILVVGILQRRKQQPDADGVQDAAGLGTPVRAAEKAPRGDLAVETDTVALPAEFTRPAGTGPLSPTDGPELSGLVLVVAGRPRYHVEGCRYLTGKQPESVEVADARRDDFTACGVCKPDEHLVPAPAAAATVPEIVKQAPVRAVRTAQAPVAAQLSGIKAAPAKAAPVKAAPVKAAAAKKAAVTAAPVKAGPAKKAATKTAPVKAAVSKAAAAKVVPAKQAATTAKAAPTKRSGVIVIPDRGKFHTAACRYVRGAEDTLELTKAAAVKQGYDACGVCKP